MTSRDFCYWLQGLFELGVPVQLDAKQTDLVKRHLAMVFVHEIDPSAGNQAAQKTLNDIHGGNANVWHHGVGPHNCTKTCPGHPDFGRASPDIGHQNQAIPSGFDVGGDGPGGVKFRC